MKDYYDILGVKPEASQEEIRNAHRKLSKKFHPDVNEGDTFFAEHFKKIQEAYEILSNAEKRQIYDQQRQSDNSHNNTSQKSQNFEPYIEFFRCNKTAVEINETLTFSWRAVNADKVILQPFGAVEAVAEKSYKMKNPKSKTFDFTLIAQNTNIQKQVSQSLSIRNKTFEDIAKAVEEELRQKEKLAEEQRKQEEYIQKKEEQPNIAVSIRLFIMWLAIILTILLMMFGGN